MSSWLLDILLVAVGGGIGGIGRYWVAGVVAQRWAVAFPWGTLVVNVSGAGGIGVLAALLLTPAAHAGGDGLLWTGFVIGVLGSYTTVSSFSLQTLDLLRAGYPVQAAFNVAGSLALCLAAAAAGYTSMHAVAGGA
ncbi:MAG: CrcB family protein [Kiloniellaceae bacterium]